jgi:dTDP-4-dehydrorhamnose reductase
VHGKLGEAAVRRTQPRHVILRTSWLYGGFGHNFLKTTVRLAQEREELSPTSAARRRRRAASMNEEIWETYHFTGSGVITWHGFASCIVAAQAPLIGRKPRVTAITNAEFPTPARRPVNSELDRSRFEQTFGFHARPWADEAIEITQAVVLA